MRRTTLLAVVALGACVIPKFETTTFDDEGEACVVRAESQPYEDFTDPIEPGDDLEVLVFFPVGCLSSSCSDILESSCEAAVDGMKLEVSSHGELQEEVNARECTADCGIMTARCPLPDLTAGEWSLTHGDQQTSFELPGAPPCSGPP